MKPQNDSHHNYCRNPDHDLKGTWCYTTDPNKRWEYCDISKCPDDTKVILTNYFAETGTSKLTSMLAEQELLHQKLDSEIIEKFETIQQTQNPNSEYWSLTSDYEEKKIYFSDFKSEEIGVFDMKTRQTTNHFKGMAHGIEGLAFDSINKNLYWTDSKLMCIMVANGFHDNYAIIYRSLHPLYGITIHPKNRRIYFSTYKMLGTSISSLDLSGQDLQHLVVFPKVYDVTGLTIDYHDERLYWNDYDGSRATVMSSDLNGNDVTKHFSIYSSQFWGIASYLDFLFVTDLHPKINSELKRIFHLWVFRKKTFKDKVIQHEIKGKPRGITIFRKPDENELKDLFEGSCRQSPPCDHICLPRHNATRKCVCSLGFHQSKDDESKCEPALISDNYLVICDSGQGKLFQLKFNSTKFYSIIPISKNFKDKITNVRIDLRNGDLYWSTNQNIQMSTFNLTSQRIILANTTATIFDVDSISNNFYFVDEFLQNILVLDTKKNVKKTIIKTTFDQTNQSVITKLVLDIRNKFINIINLLNLKIL